jgi:hypothetical protein
VSDRLVCVRVADARLIIPGSFQDRCRECDYQVWRAPSSAALPSDVVVTCQPCAKALGEFEVEIAPITPDQLDEIRGPIVDLRGRF